MLLVVKVLILIALIKLLLASENAFLCASLYTGISVFFGVLLGGPLDAVLFGAPITFGYSFLYFWLLDRFLGTGFIWWLILVGGLVAAAIVDGAVTALFGA